MCRAGNGVERASQIGGGDSLCLRASYISRPLPVTTRWAWFPNHRSNSPQDRDCREESGFKSSTSSFLVQENICQCQPELLFPPLPLQKPSFFIHVHLPFWRPCLSKGTRLCLINSLLPLKPACPLRRDTGGLTIEVCWSPRSGCKSIPAYSLTGVMSEPHQFTTLLSLLESQPKPETN